MTTYSACSPFPSTKGTFTGHPPRNPCYFLWYTLLHISPPSSRVTRVTWKVRPPSSCLLSHRYLYHKRYKKHINGHSRILNWRYLPYIRPKNKACIPIEHKIHRSHGTSNHGDAPSPIGSSTTVGLVGRGSQLGRAALELLPAVGGGHSFLARLRLRRHRRRLRRGWIRQKSCHRGMEKAVNHVFFKIWFHIYKVVPP